MGGRRGDTDAKVEHMLAAFWQWDGELPAPRFSHRIGSAIFVIEACSPGQPPLVHVLINGRFLGNGGYPPNTAMRIAAGRYDSRSLGFRAKDGAPPSDLAKWNGL